MIFYNYAITRVRFGILEVWLGNKMSYIYHGVPETMVGSMLVSLNQMKVGNPELYGKYRAKYDGREEILERQIPLLDCLWNDVIQFLPFHPRIVFEKQKNLGLIKGVPHYSFFEIDLAQLDPKKCVVYFKDAPGEENVKVCWLDDVDMSSLQALPESTINYYETLVGTGELPFNYQFVPHILYLGTVDVSGAQKIVL
jgi:hypothetical protein